MGVYGHPFSHRGIQMLFGTPRILILLAVVLAGPQAEAAVPQTSPGRSLKSLSVALMDAVERKDRGALDSLVASDFALQMPGESKVTPRDEWIGQCSEDGLVRFPI
jgi:hypothetical protein